MTAVVIGTAGHIDHGKTSLLRALTGIEADRLPEERRRGMTIDVGYAHLALPDGTELDFVDVPGHDRLVGNMLVGAGEIDAALVVVAADDGPRAQTLEHLELLDALGIEAAIAVVTKIDLVAAERVAAVWAEMSGLLARTSMAGAPIVAVSSETGEGLVELREALVRLRDRALASLAVRPTGPLRLAVDRVFVARGRGVVVTGSLRGGMLATGAQPRVEPGGRAVRVREVQVHGAARVASEGGRTALNLADVEAAGLVRGVVLTTGAGIEATSRLLALLRRPASLGEVAERRRGADHVAWPPRDGTVLRLHIGTEQADAVVGAAAGAPTGDGRLVAILRLAHPVATFVGDRAVLREPSKAGAVGGVLVLDPQPPRGISRRRMTPERIAGLAASIEEGDAVATADALVAIHGALPAVRARAATAALGTGEAATGPSAISGDGGSRRASLVLAADVVEALEAAALTAVAAHHDEDPLSRAMSLAELRARLLVELRRRATSARSGPSASAAIDRVVDALVARGRLAREGDGVRDPARTPGLPAALAAAMDRLEAALDAAAPAPLSEAAAAAGCPTEGIRALESAGRIVRPAADLAWSAATYRRLAARALAMAESGDLTPAAFRDATGTSRKYVLAILEDLDRRGILTRTATGHVPGPRAPRRAPAGPGASPTRS